MKIVFSVSKDVAVANSQPVNPEPKVAPEGLPAVCFAYFFC